MIEIQNLSFGYKKKKRALLDDFSLSIEGGKIYGLLGKNGAGKSTLLYLITGLLMPKKGIIKFDDEDVKKRLPSTLREIFIVPEEFSLPPTSLNTYIEANAPFYPNFSRDDLNKYLECFEMEDNPNLGALSMGQKKKIFMSFALATNTKLLVMDEPTNGLDIPGKSQFRKFIASGMNDEKTILISTHQVQDVDKLLEHIVVIDDSEILLNQSVESICSKLAFVESNDKTLLDESIFAAPSLQGNNLIMKNKGIETSLNLELLFNGILKEKEKISALFNQDNN